MGYNTDFYGFWTLNPPLSLAQTDYLQKFARTRRVKRNPDVIENNRRLTTIGIDLGIDAEYFVDVEDEDKSIVDLNLPPGKQPSLWDKLAVRCPISIEPIDNPDCQYRVIKCEDDNVCENLYSTNSLWQIVGVASPLENRLQLNDCIIALDPKGNRIEIYRSELDCFISIEIVLQE